MAQVGGIKTMRRLFIIRKDLHLSAGKLAAMVAHCAEGYWTHKILDSIDGVSNRDINTDEPTEYHFSLYLPADELEDYLRDSFTKTICEARNLDHLLKAGSMANELGLVLGEDYGYIDDNCLTELKPEFIGDDDKPHCRVGIWFKPLEDDVAHSISKKFKLYRDETLKEA